MTRQLYDASSHSVPVPREDREVAMKDTDKIVAAIFAAALCSQGRSDKHDDYLVEYETFLQKMVARRETSSLEDWERLNGKL